MRPTAVDSRLAALLSSTVVRFVVTASLWVASAHATLLAAQTMTVESTSASAVAPQAPASPSSAQRAALEQLSAGSRTIETAETVNGDALARKGTLTVRGIVKGDAIAVDGDVVVAPGGHVMGNVIAVNGRVRDEGGVIDGEMRTTKVAPSAQPPLSRLERTEHALKAVALVFGVGVLIALIVLISAHEPLEAVARAAERDVAASFWVGLLWQFLATPLLVASVIVLTITVVGIFAIPLAVLVWALAYAGAITLGLFAISLLLGRAFLGRGRSVHDRGALLWSLLVGLSLLATLWLIAACLVSVPTAGMLLRIGALALTWVAATVGLGAVVRSRAGTKLEDQEPTTESQIPSWQTPTPVSGVVAARRPTPINTQKVE